MLHLITRSTISNSWTVFACFGQRNKRQMLTKTLTGFGVSVRNAMKEGPTCENLSTSSCRWAEGRNLWSLSLILCNCAATLRQEAAHLVTNVRFSCASTSSWTLSQSTCTRWQNSVSNSTWSTCRILFWSQTLNTPSLVKSRLALIVSIWTLRRSKRKTSSRTSCHHATGRWPLSLISAT